MGEDVETSVYRQIIHPTAQATLKTECTKLTDFTKIIHDFLNTLSNIYDSAGSSIQKLVEENRKKISELSKENLQYNHTTLTAWNGLLENWEQEGHHHCTFAEDIKTETVTTLQEQRNHVKESVKRLYNYRDVLNSTVSREADQRDRLQKEYSGLWAKYKGQQNNGTTRKGAIMPTYTAYNSYLLQLTNSNGVTQSLLDIQMPNLMQELEAVEHNLHNFIFSVLSYTFDRQTHHFNECISTTSNSAATVLNISPADDVTKLGESLVLPPEVYHLYREKDFTPADVEENGIPRNISNGYVAKEEYTTHTLGKKYRHIRKILEKLDKDISKGNKDLDALSKLLATYQENPTYGKASDIEVKMSALRHELRLLEMEKSGYSCQLALLEESGFGVDSSGSLQSDTDEDTRSIISGTLDQGEHDWVQLSMTEMKSCDHCQRPTMLQRSYQCNKCRVNCHGSCRHKVFDCVGQPLIEQTSGKVTKLKDSIIKGTGVIFKRDAKKLTGQAPDKPQLPARDAAMGKEWWTLKPGETPNLKEYASDGEGEDDVYDTIEDIKEKITSDEDSDRDTMKAPAVIRQSDRTQITNRPPLAPPQPPVVRRSIVQTEQPLLYKNPPIPGSLYVCVALYEYKDIANSSDAWCAPGFRVDVMENTNQDWLKGVCNGKSGYFPVNYLEQVPESGVVLRCLYDYSAQETDELSISQGQVIFKLEDQDNGWIYGRIKTSRGIFPSAYVEELNDFT